MGDASSSEGSGSAKKVPPSKKKGLTLSTPAAPEPTFQLSNAGTFKKGDFVIRKSGMEGGAEKDDLNQFVDGGLSSDTVKVLEGADLGAGAFSTVKQAVHTPTGRKMALKEVNIFDRDRRHQLMNELSALSDCKSSPNILHFYGAYFNEGVILIALELMDGGSLEDLVKLGPMPEELIGAIFAQVMEGLRFLHDDRKRVHRDIKPGNILLMMDGTVKISDFGICRVLNEQGQADTFVGTTNYMAPERLQGEKYGAVSDNWSIGLSALECSIGKFPYKIGKGYFDLLNQIIETDVPSLPDGCSQEFKDFIGACLVKQPQSRPTAAALLSGPFLTKHKGKKAVVAQYLAEKRKK